MRDRLVDLCDRTFCFLDLVLFCVRLIAWLSLGARGVVAIRTGMAKGTIDEDGLPPQSRRNAPGCTGPEHVGEDFIRLVSRAEWNRARVVRNHVVESVEAPG